MSEIQNAIPLKIIMVGAMNVGKTSLVTRYMTGKCPNQPKTTKNASYVNKYIKKDGYTFEVKLWDTAGQEKYKSLTKIFTKDTKIAILVYSIDSKESFNELDNWLKLVKEANQEDLILGVAANKSDLASDNTISPQEGQLYAQKIGAIWKSTSAITENGGIEEFIDILFNKYFENNFSMNPPTSQSLTISMEDTKESGPCCIGGQKSIGYKRK